MDIRLGLTFDDVLLLPAASDVMPAQVNVATRVTKSINLNIPLLSAAMDTVTEAPMAIAMAQAGGMGVLHRNMTDEEQAAMVRSVKKYESGMVVNPVTMFPDQTLADAMELMARHKISGIPVVERGEGTGANKLVGILTHRDVRFATHMQQPASELMTKKVITVKEGVSSDEAKRLFHKHRIEKLIVVDDEYRCVGLVTVKDMEKAVAHPNACKDSKGRLRVAAATTVGDKGFDRVGALVDAECDLIVLDTAHGHSSRVVEQVERIKKAYGNVDLIAGNIATEEAAKALIGAGADGLKVGIGPGSICTTRIVAGVGVPQITAIMNCRTVYHKTGIPLIADGGVKFSGDVTKAIGAGAHVVMIGSLFAGTEESPGELVIYQGRSYKSYRGMGSIEAMQKGSRDRYYQGEDPQGDKLVPEGIVGRVPYRGTLSDNIFQLIGGLKAGMGYVGCRTLDELREKARFIKITTAGMRESHVHDVIITKEAPNYRLD